MVSTLMPKVSIVRLLIASVLTLVLTGCYYGQAARGQLELLSKREPLGKVIDDPDTPADLAARLELVSAARDFSMQPETWCFPVAGCVAYRGYFRREAAEREAEKARAAYAAWISRIAARSNFAGRISAA